MATRLDTCSEARLRNLASTLRLEESDVESAIASHGTLQAAEQALRRLALSNRSATAIITREQRITKCASQLARHPSALDILHASLAKVLNNPNAERLRKVNVAAGMFKTHVADRTPAGIELLHAVGYEPMHGHLVLQKHDPAALRLALSELDSARQLSTYREGKAAIAGEQARRQAAASDSAAAAARRAAHLAKVPAEPAAPGFESDDGRASSACVISVHQAGGERIALRRFDSDNTLANLVDFIRSLAAVPEVADASGLTILNVTTRPARRLDPEREGSASLYALDLWPRARVEVAVNA